MIRSFLKSLNIVKDLKDKPRDVIKTNGKEVFKIEIGKKGERTEQGTFQQLNFKDVSWKNVSILI